jgi:hypothetical protein
LLKSKDCSFTSEDLLTVNAGTTIAHDETAGLQPPAGVPGIMEGRRRQRRCQLLAEISPIDGGEPRSQLLIMK